MNKLIEVLIKQLKLSEEDAIIAAIFATSGFTIDSLFFPAGMPSGTVTLLSGAAGLLTSKWLKNRRFFQARILRRIDQLVEQGHLSRADAKKMKRQLIERWFGSTYGPDDD